MFLFCSCPPPPNPPPQPPTPIRPGPVRHAHRHRPRPQPCPQTDRLRQATRRHGSEPRRRPRLRPVRQTLRHRRPRRHPRPHHQWPASRRGPRSQALPSRRPRPGPHTIAHPPARRTRAARRTAGSRRRTPSRPQPANHPDRADPTEDPRLARLPTEEEIAAEVRRRPVGAVIADICRDLGITPGQLDRAFWDELSRAIIAYGGNLAGFLAEPEPAAVRPRLRRPLRPCGPRMARGTAAIAGARHRPALNAEQSQLRGLAPGSPDRRSAHPIARFGWLRPAVAHAIAAAA